MKNENAGRQPGANKGTNSHSVSRFVLPRPDVLLVNPSTGKPVEKANVLLHEVLGPYHAFMGSARVQVVFAAVWWPGSRLLHDASQRPLVSAYYKIRHECQDAIAGTPCASPLPPGKSSRVFRALAAACPRGISPGKDYSEVITKAFGGGGKVFSVTIETVTTDMNKKELPKANHYSKVDVVLGVTDDHAGSPPKRRSVPPSLDSPSKSSRSSTTSNTPITTNTLSARVAGGRNSGGGSRDEALYGEESVGEVRVEREGSAKKVVDSRVLQIRGAEGKNSAAAVPPSESPTTHTPGGQADTCPPANGNSPPTTEIKSMPEGQGAASPSVADMATVAKWAATFETVAEITLAADPDAPPTTAPEDSSRPDRSEEDGS